jgi:CubicO group peptidase (beta-lactamase class C family)
MKSEFQQAFAHLDTCLQTRMQAARTPGMVVALTDREQTVRLKAYGSANLDTHEALRADHLFAIGSIGKSFTGIAILKAFEAGLLDLNAPVSKILPWFNPPSTFEPITAHHLLTHSSGLVLGTDFSPDPRAELLALSELEPGFSPGLHLSYSDAGYKLLGLMLEAVTGKTYEQVITEWILKPLGMNQTYAVTMNQLRPQMATGYRSLYDDRPAHASYPLVPAAFVETNSGDGCIVSNAEDMARYARMLLNDGCAPDGQALLSEHLFSRMLKPMIQEDGEAYSYGLTLFFDDGYQIAGHGGDVPGYECYMWLDLDNGLGTVVLMTTPYTPRASFLTLEFFRAAYLGHRLPEEPPLPDFTQVSHPVDYAGSFQAACSGAPEFHLEAEGHHLLLVRGDQRIVLEERGVDTFYLNHPDFDRYLVRFERSHGKISEVFIGPYWYVNELYQGQREFSTPETWAAFVGHYRAHNPWYPNFRVFARKGKLVLAWPSGDEEYLVPLGENQFRVGEEAYIPERLVFDQVVAGAALRATRSGCPYYRYFMP